MLGEGSMVRHRLFSCAIRPNELTVLISTVVVFALISAAIVSACINAAAFFSTTVLERSITVIDRRLIRVV
jgi:hypothetical protein